MGTRENLKSLPAGRQVQSETRGGNLVKRDEIFGGIVIFLFGMATALLSLGMPIGTFRMAGTGLFPLCLGILLMLLSGIFLSKLFFQTKKRSMKNEVIGTQGSKKQLIFFFGTMVLVTLFFNRLGYPLTSLLLMVALLRILGVKRWGLNILISVVAAVGSYFLFVKWLGIPMPRGWIGL